MQTNFTYYFAIFHISIPCLTDDLGIVTALDLHSGFGVEDFVVLEDVLPWATIFGLFRQVAPKVRVQAIC